MKFLSTTSLTLLSILSTSLALPQTPDASLDNNATLAARDGPPKYVYNQNPPRGQCRLSGYHSKINHRVGWRVTASDGSYISSGSSGTALATSPLLGLGDDLAVIFIDNAAWKLEFMRSGTVSGDHWLSTDPERCTMNPPNPTGDIGVTITCDFSCHQKYDWALKDSGSNAIVTQAQAANAEVAELLTLPDGINAPTS